MAKKRKYEIVIKDISLNIRGLRSSLALTQEQMAEYGFNYRFYQKLESGKYSPSLRTLFRLADFFEVDISEFLKSSK